MIAPPDVAGVWTSVRCEVAGAAASVRRSFTFSRDGRWSGRVTFYRDRTCSRPAFVARPSGTYAIVKPYAAIPGAFRTEFSFARFTRTTPDGRVTVVPLPCDKERDLVARDGDRLRLGARPSDGGFLCPDARAATRLGPPLRRS